MSGPLLDRFDLMVKVDRLGSDAARGPAPESSSEIRERVVRAVAALDDDPPDVDKEARSLLMTALDAGLLTARGVDRVRRVAVTIAALDGSERAAEDHVAEAMALRSDW
jgi:magnesium chelatase family protein